MIDMTNMKRMKIELVTQNDVLEFITIATSCPTDVYIESGDGRLRISAKSMLGVKMAQVEWNDLYVLYSDDKLASSLIKFSR